MAKSRNVRRRVTSRKTLLDATNAPTNSSKVPNSHTPAAKKNRQLNDKLPDSSSKDTPRAQSPKKRATRSSTSNSRTTQSTTTRTNSRVSTSSSSPNNTVGDEPVTKRRKVEKRGGKRANDADTRSRKARNSRNEKFLVNLAVDDSQLSLPSPDLDTYYPNVEQSEEHSKKRKCCPEQHLSAKTHDASLKGEEHIYRTYVLNPETGEKEAVTRSTKAKPFTQEIFDRGCPCQNNCLKRFKFDDLQELHNGYCERDRDNRHDYMRQFLHKYSSFTKRKRKNLGIYEVSGRRAFWHFPSTKPTFEGQYQQLCLKGIAIVFNGACCRTLLGYAEKIDRKRQEGSGRPANEDFNEKAHEFLNGLRVDFNHYAYTDSPHRKYFINPRYRDLEALWTGTFFVSLMCCVKMFLVTPTVNIYRCRTISR